jgi:hypothetical protein
MSERPRPVERIPTYSMPEPGVALGSYEIEPAGPSPAITRRSRPASPDASPRVEQESELPFSSESLPANKKPSPGAVGGPGSSTGFAFTVHLRSGESPTDTRRSATKSLTAMNWVTSFHMSVGESSSAAPHHHRLRRGNPDSTRGALQATVSRTPRNACTPRRRGTAGRSCSGGGSCGWSPRPGFGPPDTS